MSDAAPFSQMVVIGSSAGGIEALSTDFIVLLEEIGARLQQPLTGSPSAFSPEGDDALDQLFSAPLERLEVRTCDGSSLPGGQHLHRRVARGESFQATAAIPNSEGSERTYVVGA